MILKDLEEAIYSKSIPPIILLHETKAPSEDISHIATTTNIGRESTI